MRRAALASSLAWQLKREAIIALENYGDETKTKTFVTLLKKLPVELGRRILVVSDGAHRALMLSGRNVPGVKVIDCQYLNVEDVTVSKHVIFLADAITKIQTMLTKERREGQKGEEGEEGTKKKAAAKKTTKKSTSASKKKTS
jgi:ribosomal protein L4